MTSLKERASLRGIITFLTGDAMPQFAPLRTALGILATILVLLVVWRLADVLLLVFGSVLIAVLLQAVARPLRRLAPIGRMTSLVIAVLLAATAVSALAWLLVSQAQPQIARLTELLPAALADVQGRLSASPLGAITLDQLKAPALADGLLYSLANGAATAIAALLIVVFAGLYLGFHPKTYLDGLVSLLPHQTRARGRQVLEACGEALRRWMVGTILSGLLVGLTTSIGLWLAGVPAPLALGFLAGAGQIVPVVGPVATAIPGLLVAFAEGPQTFGWALLVYLGAAQVEANVITPLILLKMAQLPMAVTLFAVLAMGVLLGPLGVLFATPLAVVAFVLVRTLYLDRGVLESAQPPEGPLPSEGPPRTARPTRIEVAP